MADEVVKALEQRLALKELFEIRDALTCLIRYGLLSDEDEILRDTNAEITKIQQRG